FFASGIHEEILTHVSRIVGLKVISRTSVLEYRETEKNLRTIATELGVDHVLEGSVRRAGDRLRITAQLIDARSDAHLWSETYDRTYTVDEVFAVQTDVAERIARSLNATLSPGTRQRISSGTTHDREAFELFLRARDWYNERTRRSLDEATEHLGRAVSLDPGFVRAWALLSTVHAGLY
ncbi:MAG: adenylate/guanylate cyclase domain-containing protein, partial [Gemmatimonadetes bacterium]|nr:adenylate/guanylate cyclase domain-containing protein [Gemmatimonadota bacterium]NIT88302.1 adenylate/guanylate cyclase domain-containing protein [Gemmatimonadota bacterium]NIU29857.1 adenylate/guanylate cyclase domain-containing protein [Gemmatimonadota bacterium]NIV60264.1 adenylate/guanylate cyclase domain-containing protein [Gemmatimonadota bacterium]NIW62927.1 adenylate/guanylate cyclase domain-containing protein [Gemmatimonadota bacterium]